MRPEREPGQWFTNGYLKTLEAHGGASGSTWGREGVQGGRAPGHRSSPSTEQAPEHPPSSFSSTAPPPKAPGSVDKHEHLNITTPDRFLL